MSDETKLFLVAMLILGLIFAGVRNCGKPQGDYTPDPVPVISIR